MSSTVAPMEVASSEKKMSVGHLTRDTNTSKGLNAGSDSAQSSLNDVAMNSVATQALTLGVIQSIGKPDMEARLCAQGRL